MREHALSKETRENMCVKKKWYASREEALKGAKELEAKEKYRNFYPHPRAAPLLLKENR